MGTGESGDQSANTEHENSCGAGSILSAVDELLLGFLMEAFGVWFHCFTNKETEFLRF